MTMRKLFLILIILVCVTQTSAAADNDPAKLSIATIWEAPAVVNPDGTHSLDFTQASQTVQWQRTGFEAGLRDGPGAVTINEIQIPESNNISQATSYYADLYNNQDIVMTVGASTEMNTMYAAMVTSFFEIPMLVPFSDGELFSDSSNGFSMRITPTGQKYADYIGTNILDGNLTQRINTILFQNTPVPDYEVKAALFFSDDFNDHESSVKIAQRLMDNGVNIGYYNSYSDGQLLTSVRDAWENHREHVADADVVILIPKNKDPLVELASIVNLWGDRVVPPSFIIIGYVPEYADQTVFNADNIFVLRQKIDRSQCPAEVKHLEGAMGYAAGFITKLALSRAYEAAGKEPTGWRLWLRTKEARQAIHQHYLKTFRNDIVTAMRGMTDYIPCFGPVSFLSSNEDVTELELVRYLSLDQTVPVDDSVIFYRIISRIRADYGITEW